MHNHWFRAVHYYWWVPTTDSYGLVRLFLELLRLQREKFLFFTVRAGVTNVMTCTMTPNYSQKRIWNYYRSSGKIKCRYYYTRTRIHDIIILKYMCQVCSRSDQRWIFLDGYTTRRAWRHRILWFYNRCTRSVAHIYRNADFVQKAKSGQRRSHGAYI